MKSTILVVAIVIAGIASVSCGSDVSGGVSLADAFDECDAIEMLSEGESLSDSALNTVVIQAEAFRNDGGSQTSYINQKLALCIEIEPEGASRDQCKVCIAAIAAAVWP